MIRFDVPGVPISQPRQRMAMRGARPVAYLPSKHPVNDYKALVRLAASKSCETLIDGPVCLSVIFIMSRPKSKIWKRRPMPSYPHDKKPDLDNLLKAVLDALTGIAWRDDAQICLLMAKKRVASGDEQPKTEIELWQDQDPSSNH